MTNTFIDIGSTSIKWCVDGAKPAEIPFPSNIALPPPYFEVPVKEILALLREIVNKYAKGRLFISVQMHGYVLLGKSGDAVSEYISWQDCRSALTEIPFSIEPENGVAMKANLPKAGLYAIKVSQPGLYSKTAEFCTLGSYLVKMLTGLNITHITDAAASGFYNVKTLKGYAEIKIPVATASVEPVGITGGVTVFTPVGDQQAAVLGSRAGEDCYVMNIGTAGQLCCIHPTFIEGPFESRPYFFGKTLCTVTNLYGGKAITALAQDWEDAFFKAYDGAIRKLPQKSKILVTGGFGKRFRLKLCRVLERMGLPFSFSDKEDAIEGLRTLAAVTSDTITISEDK